jgi:uncharacterized protein YkwD
MSATARSRLAALAAAAATAFALASAGPALAAADPDDPLRPPPGACAYESDVDAYLSDQRAARRCLANLVRENAGVAPLNRGDRAVEPRQGQGVGIMDCDDFRHEACGLPWSQRITDEGCWDDCSVAGCNENIVRGTGELGSAGNAINTWHSTEGHREALLTPIYRDHGVGVSYGALNGDENTQVWVHHFGYCD